MRCVVGHGRVCLYRNQHHQLSDRTNKPQRRSRRATRTHATVVARSRGIQPRHFGACCQRSLGWRSNSKCPRLRALHEIPVLESTDEAIQLAKNLIHYRALPAKATEDATHISIAAVYGIDYLLTWNCKHIANATMRGTIEEICRFSGFRPPTICTPAELPIGSLE
jgi:hypothetical protein